VSAPEERVFRLFNDRSDKTDLAVWALMQSGSLAAVFAVSGELLRRGRRRAASATCVTGVAVWGGVKLVKPLVGRGRPAHHLEGVSVRGQAQTGLGYPSGHAAVALALALIATRESSPVVRATALAAAGFTGGARMYVGAHLPLDVAGGFAIGALCGRAANAASNCHLHPVA
jgi:membrane-associated phospholipid phosphatase